MESFWKFTVKFQPLCRPSLVYGETELVLKNGLYLCLIPYLYLTPKFQFH